jgi:hypothetical protein
MRSSLLVLFLGGLMLLSPKAEAQPASAPPPALTAEQWREDLRFLATEMRTRHANLYHAVSKAEFDAAEAGLDARIPSLKRNQIIVEMMRIAAMVGDGHTRIEPRKDPAFAFPSLPLKLYLFEDGLYVRAAAPGHADLVGARVESIGGVPVGEAVARVSKLASHENVSGPRLYAPLYLAMPDVLQAVGLSPDTRNATFGLSKDGRKWTAKIAAAAVDPVWPPDTDISLVTPRDWIDAHSGAAPLWLQAPLDLYRLIDLPDRKALYVQLNMVTDLKEENLTQFGERIRRRAADANPTAIVLDLRLNTGGNGDLRQGLIRSLIKAEDEDTRLFVLTARGTFSASQFILDDLDRLTGAVFIGEPASSRPTGYGDAFRSTMPNSGINVRTSIKYWQSGQDMRPWTPIDIAAPLTFADYVAGRDPALEAALDYTPPVPFAQAVVAAAKAGGSEAVAKAANALLADPVLRYAERERMLVRGQDALLRAGLKSEAIALGKLAMARFPKYGDIALVLAAAAESAGDKELARSAAEATLRIDPNNRSAATILRNLVAPAS